MIKFFTIAIMLISSPILAAAELKPAHKFLPLIQDLSSNEEETLTPPQQLMSDIQLSKVGDDQKAYVAVWLGWFDRFWSMDATVRGQYFDAQYAMGLKFERLLMVFPSPKLWPDLIKSINKRAKKLEDKKKRYMLLMIAALLEGDLDTQMSLSKEYYASLSSDELYSAYEIEGYIDDIFFKSSDKKKLQQYLNDKLNRAKAKNLSSYIHLPNLIPTLGKDDTVAAIRQILQTENAYIDTNSIEMSNIVKREIIELGDKVKTPQWRFIDAIDPISIKLYESASFLDSASTESGSVAKATIYYLFSLVTNQQIDKALLVAKDNNIKISSISKGTYQKIINSGYAKSVYQFVQSYMAQHNDKELLDAYIDLSIAAGKHRELLSYLQKMRKNTDNSDSTNIHIEIQITKAYFAVGDTKKGLHSLNVLRKNYLKNKAAFATFQDELLDLAVDIMNAGYYSDNARWYDTGKAFAKQLNHDELASKNTINYNFVDALFTKGDLAEAQDILLEHARITAASANFEASPQTPKYLMLAYAAAGQCKDAITFLDGYKMWGAMDVMHLALQSVGKPSTYVGEYLATCLIDQGDMDTARSILELLMVNKPGYDPAYALYKKTVGADTAIAYFNNLYRFDAFEERPLIWKASVLQDQGKLTEALGLLQKALTIDPSDGEQHLGRRMLAYQLMGEVYHAMGDTAKAQDFKSIIGAIRLAEKADRLNSAGFNQQSLSMYDEALKRFSGAYCIQSRLAVRQNAFGLTEQSLEHYRRAYELMPDSFGYLESHCLGCSAVFSNKSGQELAEKVFQDLLSSDTNKPQAFYMMGYLKKTQDDYTSAWAFFQKAATMDPNYINAWKEMNKVQRELVVNQADYDDIIVNLIRLDPMVHHVDIDEHTVRDLKALWDTTKVAGDLVIPKTKSIHRLNASADLIESSLSQLNPAQRKILIEYYSSSPTTGRDKPITPAEVLLQHKGFRAISSLMDI